MNALDRYPVGPHADLRGRDTCETCAHAVMRRVWSLEHRMCDQPEVVARREGALVSAGIARDYLCHGRQWAAKPRNGTAKALQAFGWDEGSHAVSAARPTAGKPGTHQEASA